MAYTTINKSTDYFNTKLYTGNGSTQSITGVGFTQDFTWIKSRSTAQNHYAFDTVRGAQKQIYPSTSSAEDTGQSNGLNAFTSDGFNLGTEVGVNGNGATFASWNWKANGTGSANTDGTINSTVSASATSGFSIVSYTGNGTAGATIGHGLGVKPAMIIVKKLNGAYNWGIYHKNIGATKLLAFTDAIPDDDASYWNDVEPTSSVFNLGSSALTNGSGSTMIAYCFSEVKGYSKFSSYTGNGNADGTFVYTGFKPAWVMIKNITTANSYDDWMIFDNKRNSNNPMGFKLYPSNSASESNDIDLIDFTSNGFKQRSANSNQNGSGNSFIYMAIAEAPLVGTNGVTAKAR